MGIYLPNMEMPQEGFVEILVRDDGTVLQTGQSYRIDGTDYYTPYVGEMPTIYKAVPVPPHGRLIDTSEKIRVQLYDDMTEDFHMVEMTIDDLLSQGWVEAVAPTIIPTDPAEEGETCILM